MCPVLEASTTTFSLVFNTHTNAHFLSCTYR
jgi:hypothetical protein